ncbi:MAG: hypothetical protein IT368_16565 [Candidatus Hydrogenedentes bacterium]|nr:hypothetical protein [Candidatus Hydrogenedentota bacterium]
MLVGLEDGPVAGEVEGNEHRLPLPLVVDEPLGPVDEEGGVGGTVDDAAAGDLLVLVEAGAGDAALEAGPEGAVVGCPVDEFAVGLAVGVGDGML